MARDCENRGKCFVCGSETHRASWHDRENESNSESTAPVTTEYVAASNNKASKGNDDADKEDQEEEEAGEAEISGKKAETNKEERKVVSHKSSKKDKEQVATTSSTKKQGEKKRLLSDVVKQAPTKDTKQAPKRVSKAQGFWDESLTESRKRKSTGHDEQPNAENKIVRENESEETNSDMELDQEYQPENYE